MVIQRHAPYKNYRYVWDVARLNLVVERPWPHIIDAGSEGGAPHPSPSHPTSFSTNILKIHTPPISAPFPLPPQKIVCSPPHSPIQASWTQEDELT